MPVERSWFWTGIPIWQPRPMRLQEKKCPTKELGVCHMYEDYVTDNYDCILMLWYKNSCYNGQLMLINNRRYAWARRVGLRVSTRRPALFYSLWKSYLALISQGSQLLSLSYCHCETVIGKLCSQIYAQQKSSEILGIFFTHEYSYRDNSYIYIGIIINISLRHFLLDMG